MPESDGHRGNDSTDAATRHDAAGAGAVDDMTALLAEIDATCGLIDEPASAVEEEIQTLTAAVDRLATAREGPVVEVPAVEVPAVEAPAVEAPVVEAPVASGVPTGGAPGPAEVVDSDTRDAMPADHVQGEHGEEIPAAPEKHALPEAPVAPPADPEPTGNEPAIAPVDDVDAAGSDASPSDGGSPPADAAKRSTSTLSELDDSLAEDAEDLLNANFDTVSDVLDEVFDEQAAIVQEPAADAIASFSSDAVAGGDESETEAPIDDEALSSESASAEPAVQEENGDAIQSMAIPDREEASALIPDRDPSETPSPEDADPTDVAPAALDENESEMLPEAAHAPAALDDLEPDLEPDLEADLEPGPLAADLEPAAAGASLWSKIEPAVIRLLTIVNAPLRLLPQRVQPYVDWIALSLVFWVPIVWVVAFFVVGS